MSSTLIQKYSQLANARQDLLGHTMYRSVCNQECLRSFMEAHVFAVWDFMSLAKRLQRDLTCVSVPWLPRADREAARLINEIILSEESDLDPNGATVSHLDLYLAGMEEVGADTSQFRRFVGLVERGALPDDALRECAAPSHVAAFVATTLRVAQSGGLEEALAYFFFGREDVIPEMFERLVSSLGSDLEAPFFRYYLSRHIELDGGEHGPAAQDILSRHLQSDERLEKIAVEAAVKAIQARVDFFTGIETGLPTHALPAVLSG